MTATHTDGTTTAVLILEYRIDPDAHPADTALDIAADLRTTLDGIDLPDGAHRQPRIRLAIGDTARDVLDHHTRREPGTRRGRLTRRAVTVLALAAFGAACAVTFVATGAAIAGHPWVGIPILGACLAFIAYDVAAGARWRAQQRKLATR